MNDNTWTMKTKNGLVLKGHKLDLASPRLHDATFLRLQVQEPFACPTPLKMARVETTFPKVIDQYRILCLGRAIRLAEIPHECWSRDAMLASPQAEIKILYWLSEHGGLNFLKPESARSNPPHAAASGSFPHHTDIQRLQATALSWGEQGVGSRKQFVEWSPLNQPAHQKLCFLRIVLF
jgi:hypothetical protein